jgi:hypothetical protein
LIGLGDYEIDPTLDDGGARTGGSTGGGSGGSGSGGDASGTGGTTGGTRDGGTDGAGGSTSGTGGTSGGAAGAGGSCACDDGVDCTDDTCDTDGECVHTPNHANCPDSGDVCTPNQCDAELDCQQVDVSTMVELLADGNLDVDDGTSWTELLVPNDPNGLIYDVEDIGPQYSAHTTPNVAWMGGLDDSIHDLCQEIMLPAGTVELVLTGQIWVETVSTNGADADFAAVRILEDLTGTDGCSSVSVQLRAEFDNWTPADEVLDWVPINATRTVPASWLTKSLTLDVVSSTDDIDNGDDDYSSFFFDSLSLQAKVCQ